MKKALMAPLLKTFAAGHRRKIGRNKNKRRQVREEESSKYVGVELTNAFLRFARVLVLLVILSVKGLKFCKRVLPPIVVNI